jgi:hypothetical protein
MTRIKLNVGGHLFETTEDTLMKSDYFKAFLTNWSHDKEIFIDRSARLFHHVLCLLRDPSYPFPTKYVGELDFYQVPHNIKKRKSSNQILMEKSLKSMEDKIDKLNVDGYFTTRIIKQYIHDVNRPGNGVKLCQFWYCGNSAWFSGYCDKHKPFFNTNIDEKTRWKRILEERNRLYNVLKKQII